MKIRQVIWMLMVLMGFVETAVASNLKVVAPIYPGAILDQYAGDVTVTVYLSHDPLDEVRSWYASRLGTFTPDAGVTLLNADQVEQLSGRPNGAMEPQVEQSRLGHVVMNQSTVVRSLKDMTRTKDIGVLCEGMKLTTPKDASVVNHGASTSVGSGDNAMLNQIDVMQSRMLQQASQEMHAIASPLDRRIASMGDLFDGLRQEALSEEHGHRKEELLKVYAKYSHLESDWYPTVKTENGLESYDQWLLAKDKAKLHGDKSVASGSAKMTAAEMQQLSARIQAAAAAGRMEEMQALSSQMQQAIQGQQSANQVTSKAILKDHWGFWMEFLKQLDAHAYRTRIWVNTKPSSWGY